MLIVHQCAHRWIWCCSPWPPQHHWWLEEHAVYTLSWRLQQCPSSFQHSERDCCDSLDEEGGPLQLCELGCQQREEEASLLSVGFQHSNVGVLCIQMYEVCVEGSGDGIIGLGQYTNWKGEDKLDMCPAPVDSSHSLEGNESFRAMMIRPVCHFWHRWHPVAPSS